jgi:hypothetical protein
MAGEDPIASFSEEFKVSTCKEAHESLPRGVRGVSAKGNSRSTKSMKLTRIITVTIAGVLMTTAARAVHVWEDPGAWSTTTFSYNATAPKYGPNELSLDLFGSYWAPERGLNHIFETNIRGERGRWGGGAGVNYFFTPWLGIGGDANWSDHRGFGGPATDWVMGNLILRLPIGNTGFAPYVYGGGGRQFNGLFRQDGELFAGARYEWMADLGAGIEYRITPGFGIFGDGRYMWHLKDGGVDRIALRTGIRIAF